MYTADHILDKAVIIDTLQFVVAPLRDGRVLTSSKAQLCRLASGPMPFIDIDAISLILRWNLPLMLLRLVQYLLF